MVPFHVFAATHPRFTCPLPSTCVCRQPRLPAPTGSGPRPCRGASRDLRFLLVRVDSRLSIFNRVSFFFPQVILAERSTNLFRIRTSMTPLSQLLYNPHLQAPLGSAGNKGLITPLESALTKNSPATLLESALTETGGWGCIKTHHESSSSFPHFCYACTGRSFHDQNPSRSRHRNRAGSRENPDRGIFAAGGHPLQGR